MQEYVIKTDALSKLYDGNNGCREITLQVPKGVVYGFLGPNGAGKSTFVRTLLGLIHPTSGSGIIYNYPIGSIQSREKIGYLPELFRYPDWMSGRQLLTLHAELSHLDRSETKKRVPELLDRVGLGTRGDEKIRKYSKGMQQRIGLACALIANPELIFLDEPTSALDPIGRKDVRELINDLKQEGKTIFLNSHLLGEVESVCDDVAIIHRGQLLVQGNWRDLALDKNRVQITVERIKKGEEFPRNPLVIKQKETRQTDSTVTWVFTLAEGTTIPQLVTTLATQGLAIHEVTPQQQHLEDLFMYWVNRTEGKN